MVPAAVEAGDAIAAFLSSRLPVESFGFASPKRCLSSAVPRERLRQPHCCSGVSSNGSLDYHRDRHCHRARPEFLTPPRPTLRAPLLAEAARVQAWREASDLELSDARAPIRSPWLVAPTREQPMAHGKSLSPPTPRRSRRSSTTPSPLSSSLGSPTDQ